MMSVLLSTSSQKKQYAPRIPSHTPPRKNFKDSSASFSLISSISSTSSFEFENASLLPEAIQNLSPSSPSTLQQLPPSLPSGTEIVRIKRKRDEAGVEAFVVEDVPQRESKRVNLAALIDEFRGLKTEPQEEQGKAETRKEGQEKKEDSSQDNTQKEQQTTTTTSAAQTNNNSSASNNDKDLGTFAPTSIPKSAALEDERRERQKEKEKERKLFRFAYTITDAEQIRQLSRGSQQIRGRTARDKVVGQMRGTSDAMHKTEPDYVIDVYYRDVITHNTQLEAVDVVRLESFDADLVFPGEEYDESSGESSDSNGESNPRNDYPDEEDVLSESAGSEGSEDESGSSSDEQDEDDRPDYYRYHGARFQRPSRLHYDSDFDLDVDVAGMDDSDEEYAEHAYCDSGSDGESA